MGMIGVLIGITIALVVGVSLIPVVTDQVNSLVTADVGTSVKNLANLIPIIFSADNNNGDEEGA